MYSTITHGSSRAVEIYENYVYKYPKSEEGKYCSDSEIYIWKETKHPWLCQCEKIDEWCMKMEKVYCDISQGGKVYTHQRGKLNFSNGFWELVKLHPNLEFGIDESGNPKIYDYADVELDWSLDNPEDKFIKDLLKCSK